MERIGVRGRALAIVAAFLVAMALLGGAAVAAMQPGLGNLIGHGIGAKGDLIGAAATYIGITADELRQELGAGKTLAQVATEHGKTRDGLVAALTDASNAAIDQAVTDGRITAERAAELKQGVAERVERIVDSTRPLGRGCRNGDGDGDGNRNGSSGFSPGRGAGQVRGAGVPGLIAFGRP
jgi:hypothetical protein